MTTLAQIRAGLPRYPIEVAFPDVDRWKTGNTGIDYVHTFDSGVEGPHVAIMALTHGNEVSGAIAVDELLSRGIRPRRGKLTLAFGNVAAYHAFDPDDIDATRYLEEDMNRVWLPQRLQGPATTADLARAQQLRPLIDEIDWLLDIHSMHEHSAPLMMTGPLEKGLRLAAQLGTPEFVIADAGHQNGRRLRDFGGFGEGDSPKNALLIETGQHVLAVSRQIALDCVARFLLLAEVVDEAAVADLLQVAKPVRQRFLRVTDAIVADTLDFRFTQDFKGLETIAEAGTLIATDGEREIRTPYANCVLIQPSIRHLGSGVTVVRLARELGEDEVPR